MSKWRLIGVTLVLLTSLTVLNACSSQVEQSQGSNFTTSVDSKKVGTAIGDTAPDFELTGMDGSHLKSIDLHGKLAVLIFWTAWCPIAKRKRHNSINSQHNLRRVACA